MSRVIRNIERMLEDLSAAEIARESGLSRVTIGKLKNGEQSLADTKYATIMALSEASEKFIRSRKQINFETEIFIHATKNFVKAVCEIENTPERMYPDKKIIVRMLYVGKGKFFIQMEEIMSRNNVNLELTIPRMYMVDEAFMAEHAKALNVDAELLTEMFKKAHRYYENADVKNMCETSEQEIALLKSEYKKNA